MHSLTARFRSYPVLLQWLLIGMTAVAVVLLWKDFIWARAVEWNERADAYERAVSDSQRTVSNLPRTTQEAIVALGEMNPPGSKPDGAAALSREINAILARYNTTNEEVKDKAPVPFRRNEMPQIIPAGRSGEKLSTEVRFSSSQEDAYRIIAELERSPHIATVSSVLIMRSQNPNMRQVVTRLSVESWVSTADLGSTAGGFMR